MLCRDTGRDRLRARERGRSTTLARSSQKEPSRWRRLLGLPALSTVRKCIGAVRQSWQTRAGRGPYLTLGRGVRSAHGCTPTGALPWTSFLVWPWQVVSSPLGATASSPGHTDPNNPCPPGALWEGEPGEWVMTIVTARCPVLSTQTALHPVPGSASSTHTLPA